MLIATKQQAKKKVQNTVQGWPEKPDAFGTHHARNGKKLGVQKLYEKKEKTGTFTRGNRNTTY